MDNTIYVSHEIHERLAKCSCDECLDELGDLYTCQCNCGRQINVFADDLVNERIKGCPDCNADAHLQEWAQEFDS